jgi:uncharacterized protein YbbC (DUF1343 family)
MKAHVLSGLDSIASCDAVLRGRRIGLMTNPTGIDHDLSSTIDILQKRYGLSALFGCEHGVRGDAQAGDDIETYVDPETGVTVFSVYGKSHRLSQEMLDAFDVLVFDIQDVGARFYTYLYSLSYAMEECAGAGKSMLVLDRVNPIGGVKRCGTILDLNYRSFVGDYELPTQYGLTIGEYAQYVRHYLKLDLDLTVAQLTGWKREMYLDDTDLPWVAPSPNCQKLDTALVYIGTCIFEGTNVSEGRGTTLPFEVIGAPWIDSSRLEKRMAELNLKGVRFRRTSFKPTFSKHQGQLCHGVQMHVVDRDGAEVFLAGLKLLETIRDMYPDKLEYLSWDQGKTHSLDKLLGTDSFRTGRLSADELTSKHASGVDAFAKAVQPFLLYR